MACGRVGAAAAVLVLATNAVAAFYEPGKVHVLTSDNFERKLEQGLWLVWCSICKDVEQEWGKVATALRGVVHVADLNAEERRSLANEYGVKGYPTVLFMYADAFGTIKVAGKYVGIRTAKHIVAWALGMVQALAMERIGEQVDVPAAAATSAEGHADEEVFEEAEKAEIAGDDDLYANTDVVLLTNANFDEKVLQSQDNWLVEFYAPWCGHCKELKATWINVAVAVKGQAAVAALDCTQHWETCSRFGVTGYPTLKKFGPNKAEPEEFAGYLTVEELSAFATAKEKAKRKDEFYDGTGVVVLGSEDFRSKVLESEGVWLVQFYAPFCGSCKRLRSTWIELAAAVQGSAHVGSVDCAQHWETCRTAGVTGYPSIQRFGADKAKPQEYQGDHSLGALSAFAVG